MDWYSCNKSEGGCEGYVDLDVIPGPNDGNNVCNCGGLHIWSYEKRWLTDTNKYPPSNFRIK